MTRRSATHSTFVIERSYPASPARVFQAFADPVAKSRWFGGPKEWNGKHELDFRVGGTEHSSGGPKGGPVHRYDARFQDIVPNERIVLTYDMHLDAQRISVSVQTVELRPEGRGTKLTLTEQGVYLDGYDDAGQREGGTRQLLEMLGASLERDVA